MKFTLNKQFLKENIYDSLRKAGYHFQKRNNKESELIFSRLLERTGYPRFHLYLKIDANKIIFNLHLDQKKPSYKGTPAHSGEHEGEIIEKEVERIKQSSKNK